MTAMVPQLDQISPFARELTALYVEDDAVSRLMVAAQLRGVFKELILAADGQEGLEAFRARSPQLVLTDNRMPRLSGIAMTESIRELDARVPVIFLTATMDTPLLVRAIELGIAAFLTKPVALASLRLAVARVVGLLEIEHLHRRTVEQELALLHFQEKYHESQQELAFRFPHHRPERSYLQLPGRYPDRRGPLRFRQLRPALQHPGSQVASGRRSALPGPGLVAPCRSGDGDRGLRHAAHPGGGPRAGCAQTALQQPTHFPLHRGLPHHGP